MYTLLVTFLVIVFLFMTIACGSKLVLACLSKLIGFAASPYHECGPNQALIVSGWKAGKGGRDCRIFLGKGAFVLPLVQKTTYLSLELMPLKLESVEPVLTKDGEAFHLVANAQIKVIAEEEAVYTAIQLFLSKTTEQIKSIAAHQLSDVLRSVVGKLNSCDVQTNHSLITQEVKEQSEAAMVSLGLTLVSCSLVSVVPVQTASLDVVGGKVTELTL